MLVISNYNADDLMQGINQYYHASSSELNLIPFNISKLSAGPRGHSIRWWQITELF